MNSCSVRSRMMPLQLWTALLVSWSNSKLTLHINALECDSSDCFLPQSSQTWTITSDIGNIESKNFGDYNTQIQHELNNQIVFT